MKISYFVFVMVLGLVTGPDLRGQSVDELLNSYSGRAEWDEEKAELSFTSAGIVTFENKGTPKQHFWIVPPEVKIITINADVQVTCAFHTQADCTIRGMHRMTSVVYGTDIRNWAQTNGVKAFRHCQFQNLGGTMTVKNLTSLNPFGFHVRGGGNLVMVSDCDFLDRRGGSGNHSDGIEGGDGSVIENCYFETGDDVIKVYHSLTVRNCTINMIRNAVPIQLGWGDTGDDTGDFHNLVIYGDSGRGNDDNAIIVGRQGTYTKTINIHGCRIENPNASWISLREEEQVVMGEVSGADIRIEKHRSKLHTGRSDMVICGSGEEKNVYNCMAE